MTVKMEEKAVRSSGLQPEPKPLAGKNAAIGIRTENYIKLAAMKAAVAERRSVSSLCEKLIVDYLVAAGYLRPEDARTEPPPRSAEDDE
jgi:hypothetical protein